MTTAAPSARWRAFCLVKAGNAPDEYEDAFAANAAGACFAVADGASETSFAALWARLLVEKLIASPRFWQQDAWLAAARSDWAAEVDGRPLPWYAEAKREEGAFATLFGLCFRAAAPGRGAVWLGACVGDCCLFHLRQGRLVRSYPSQDPGDFTSRPCLVGSRGGEWPARRVRGRWRAGDRFLLTTDALAHWLLWCQQRGGQPIEEIESLLAESDPPAAFPTWAEQRRRDGWLRNDDLTLLVIDL
jgi:hypothetical protein